jgi:nucleoid DNA-binding protein
LSRTDASDFVEIFLELISETLLREESVMFSGFGKFQVVKRAARKGRNVKLGVDVMIEPRLAIVFKPAPNLVSRLNETTDDAQKHATAAA